MFLDRVKVQRELDRKTVKIGDCWIWKGAVGSDGYGLLFVDKKLYRVNRLSAHIFLGLNLDSKMQALHQDQCPNKVCWNPEHLYIGTASDNTTDWNRVKGYPKGVQKRLRPYCRKGHSLTEEDSTYARRTCRICALARAKKRYYKEKRGN